MSNQSSGLQEFKNLVGIKFQLYNSLFTSLPFHRIEKTGIFLSLLLTYCEDGYHKKQSPVRIIEEFFSKHNPDGTDREKSDILFRFVQYVERQVVLFDALEDAAFTSVNDMGGTGSLKHLFSEIIQYDKEGELKEKLKDYAVRLVLTAHPTQFYPGPVLGIINDLSRAVIENNAAEINTFMQQLGKTPFFKKQKPTPYDEAISLIWYLENVFYHAAGKLLSSLKSEFPDAVSDQNPVIQMGFWPGGDRDGNPFVKTETTLKVAESLRTALLRCYYFDVRRLKRRLTFKEVDLIIADWEEKLYQELFNPDTAIPFYFEDMLKAMMKIREVLIYQNNGLFLTLVDNFISKMRIFGLHFATLDLRQESSVHEKVLKIIHERDEILPDHYESLDEKEKLKILAHQKAVSKTPFSDELTNDTLASVRAVKTIQEKNGEAGCNRYIISQCNSARNVMEVYALFLLGGWKKDHISLDIVPLFETVEDLQHAAGIMTTLYTNPEYRAHLKRRNGTQTIMVGFSDGTKDGGYLMANWGIYKAKEELTRVSQEHGVRVVFFDGRGGPPARGGGKTHRFYSSLGKNIANEQIQLTVQGQTVSSNFGTVDSAQFNIEQLVHAGIANDLFSARKVTLSEEEEILLSEMAEISYKAYAELKDHDYFTEYLSEVSPLQFYGETNIGSRPSKRKNSGKLELKDLRAIPFVGAFSQLKQNVTGYYGVGAALQEMEKKGKWKQVRNLYHNSPYFKTLLDNSEMAMKKCFFPLTETFSRHPLFGKIWRMIFNEFELTKKYIFKLSGKQELMSDYPIEQLSIQMRERIVLPLSTIQQFAIVKYREAEKSGSAMKKIYEKLIIRCSFGIINAARNSA
ncbi:MAG TPA: phosphoenolpyruvate carboxylase [Chitinophagaceae bacterium]|nr:phosphoenolpyruvate carboxylase [Chitinophagaceae bacterium]